MADKTDVFCLMGPTASGKTALACALVERLPMEIISVDSAMVYRDMTIGTAKPDAETLRRAPHHLIDIVDPTDAYSAARFCHDATLLINAIIARGRVPLLVGGTMLYFRALQQGLSLLPSADEVLRAQLLQEGQAEGWEHMHRKLAAVDATSAARIHPNDAQRIQRALEVYYLTDTPLSAFFTAAEVVSPYRFINMLLLPEDRTWLHQRIASRFEEMLSHGLVEEVEGLLQKWSLTMHHPSLRSVGYRQVLLYLQGAYDYSTLRDKGVAASRQLAKRQLTWLRHWPDSLIFAADDTGNLAAMLRAILIKGEYNV